MAACTPLFEESLWNRNQETRKLLEMVKTGDAGAQTALGQKYELGKGVKKSQTRAKEWYQRAVAQGDPLAMFLLYPEYFHISLEEAVNVKQGEGTMVRLRENRPDHRPEDKADLDAIVELLRDPENSSRVWEYAANVLEDLGAEAAPVADDIRAFLKEQGDEFAQKQSSTVGQLRQYLDKVK